MRKRVVIAALVLGPLVVAALVYGGSLMKDRSNAEHPVAPADADRKGIIETPDPAREVVFLAPGFT